MRTKRFFFPSCILLFRWMLVLFACGCTGTLGAQETVVVGQVLDKTTRTPLESVSVYFKGTNVHTQTSADGYFLLRNIGGEATVVVFSLIGYNRDEIRVKPGSSVGVEILLEEQVNLLDELFVSPGANPANDLMKKVRQNRNRNNIAVALKSNQQSVVFLSRSGSYRGYNRIFRQFKNEDLSMTDSSLLLPLYMEQTEYRLSDRLKIPLHKETFNTSSTALKVISSLLNGLTSNVNFYNNSISVQGKHMVSPLAGIGSTFYRYYLTDSVRTAHGKEYVLRFRSKNTKNLAFNGEMGIDSATYALTYINAELPRQANINFVHHLQLHQTFCYSDNVWVPQKEKTAWGMTYDLLKESDFKSASELLVMQKSNYSADKELLVQHSDSFADSPYSQQQLAVKMDAVQQTPFYKTAAYIADAFLTGYARVGAIDVGPLVSVARLTQIEGLRLGVPFRTNEHLWSRFLLGGHIAYGTRDKMLKYSVEMQWKLPIKDSRIILGVKYMDDYRRIDYDYNNFLRYENPLTDGDENIVTTLFSFKEQHRISRRKEFSAFLFNDWSADVESKWIYRDVTYLPNELLRFEQNGVYHPFLRDRNFSMTTRFSFGERVLEEHFQRLYLKSDKPIIYATVGGGQYHWGDRKGNYAQTVVALFHRGQFMLGEWRYMLSGGKIFGEVPYPMLKLIQANRGGIYNRFEFALMNDREYVADAYATCFGELITNGILFNNIPLIKHLNLREIANVKMAYGTLTESHRGTMKSAGAVSGAFQRPYGEMSVGFCNLFGMLSVQSVWRLSDLNRPNISRWGIKCNVIVML